MARGRKKKEVEATNVEPNFEAAAAIITNEIRPDKEDMSKIQGDLSASWKRVEGAGVNKKAAKDVAKLLSMSIETRDDYLRSFRGMMQQFNIGISADLVDAAEGNVSEAPIVPVRASTSESSLLN